MTKRDSNSRHVCMGAQVEHDRCDDDGDERSCAICRGDALSSDFVSMVEQAAAQPGLVMTADEFTAWLDGQAASSL